MKTFLLLTLTAIFSTSALLACTVVTTETIPPISQASPTPVKKSMKAFASEQELARYFKELAEKYKGEQRATGLFTADSSNKSAANEPAPASAKEESVTNTQHAGVDEGGIVNVIGRSQTLIKST